MKRTSQMPGTTPHDAVLIMIDVQKGFDEPLWGRRNNPGAEKNMAKILEAWRNTRRPIVHVKHTSQTPSSPLRPRYPWNEIKDSVRPRGKEPIIEKSVNSAFIGTDLEERLRRSRLHTLVMVGLTTDHCVSTTARMGGNLGFNCYVVSDTTATFDRVGYDGRKYSAEEMHETALASLHGEFATVLDTEELLASI